MMRIRPTGAPPNQICDPSPEKPTFRVGLNPGMWLSGVRFTKLAEPTCVSHTSSGPLRSDRNVANLPSGDSAAWTSSPSKFVNRVNVALVSGLSGANFRRLIPHPARADPSATSMIAAHRLHRELGQGTVARSTAVAGAFP